MLFLVGNCLLSLGYGPKGPPPPSLLLSRTTTRSESEIPGILIESLLLLLLFPLLFLYPMLFDRCGPSSSFYRDSGKLIKAKKYLSFSSVFLPLLIFFFRKTNWRMQKFSVKGKFLDCEHLIVFLRSNSTSKQLFFSKAS